MKKYKGIYVYEPGIKTELEKKYPKYKVTKRSDSEQGVTKFIKLENVTYESEDGSKVIPYTVATRPTKVKKPNTPDAVSALTYFVKDGQVYYLVGNQFRAPIGRREISLFAGLVDPKDMEDDVVEKGLIRAITRELGEESGAKIIKIIPISGVMAKSAGFSDETEQSFLAEVDIENMQPHLEVDEDIFSMIVPASEMENFLEEFGSDISIVLQNAMASSVGISKYRTFIKDSINKNKESEDEYE